MIELRAESRHRMKQSPCKPLARARCVINMTTQCIVQIVDLPSARGEPLARIPAGIKFSGSENRFHPVRHRQRGVENCATDFQMRIKRLARDEQTHDLARAFENRVDPAVAQETLHWNSRFAPTFQGLRRLIAATTANLHCVVRNFPGCFGGPHLAHRSLNSQNARLTIDQARREKRHRFHRERVSRHF